MTAARAFLDTGRRRIKFHRLIAFHQNSLNRLLLCRGIGHNIRRNCAVNILINDHIRNASKIQLRGRKCIENNRYASISAGNNMVIGKDWTVYL